MAARCGYPPPKKGRALGAQRVLLSILSFPLIPITRADDLQSHMSDVSIAEGLPGYSAASMMHIHAKAPLHQAGREAALTLQGNYVYLSFCLLSRARLQRGLWPYIIPAALTIGISLADTYDTAIDFYCNVPLRHDLGHSLQLQKHEFEPCSAKDCPWLTRSNWQPGHLNWGGHK